MTSATTVDCTFSKRCFGQFTTITVEYFLIMGETLVTHHTEKRRDGSLFKDPLFWSRVITHIKKDMLVTFSFVRYIGGILCAVILGIALFLLEFDLLKQFILYIIVLPLSLFLVIKYLTLLPVITFFFFLFIKPVYTVTILSFVVPLSFIWVLLM